MVMFIWSFRDPFGIKISISVTLAWVSWYMICYHLNWLWFELSFLTFVLSFTFVALVNVCRNAKRVEFNSEFSRQHAFPTDTGRERATFIWHLAGFAIFFLPSLLTVMLESQETDVGRKPYSIFIAFLMGLPGLIGIMQHFTRRTCGLGNSDDKTGEGDDN
jgi:hypothetical protein